MTSGPESWKHLHDGRLAAMLEAAEAAGDLTLTHYQQASLVVEAKADDSPVTIADKSAEQLVRQRIGNAFKDDTVQGEEFADAVGASRYRWIVDPIDGTKSFVCGVPLYSTLLALLIDDVPFAGVIVIPALGETICAAVGMGCWYRPSRDGSWGQAHVSSKADIRSSVLLTSQRDLFKRRGAETGFSALEEVAWDIAAMGPILGEAGGRFSDWKGIASVTSGEGVATNGKLHDEVLRYLASQ